MGRIRFGGDQSVIEKRIHEHLHTLAGNGTSAGQLRNGLRTEAGETTENAATSGGEFAIAVKLSGNGAEAMEQGDVFFDEAGEGRWLGGIIHDNYNVIMTTYLSNVVR